MKKGGLHHFYLHLIEQEGSISISSLYRIYISCEYGSTWLFEKEYIFITVMVGILELDNLMVDGQCNGHHGDHNSELANGKHTITK